MDNTDNGSDLSKRYALGIDEIDGHHRMLFGFIDDLEQALAREEHWVILHDILDKLHRWTEIHFAVEESLMRILGYPELAKHARSHQIFVADLRRRRENVVTRELTADTVNWLRGWLRGHIGIEDRHYAEFYALRLGSSPADKAEPASRNPLSTS